MAGETAVSHLAADSGIKVQMFRISPAISLQNPEEAMEIAQEVRDYENNICTGKTAPN